MRKRIKLILCLWLCRMDGMTDSHINMNDGRHVATMVNSRIQYSNIFSMSSIEVEEAIYLYQED